MNNQLLFAPEDQDSENLDNKPSDVWKIAIIDDDILVHQVTKMVLEDFTFDGKPVEFLGAFSQKEGYKLFEEHNDIAVCILDVIMETDDAGIKLAHDIREKLNNQNARIVLRTGQPGLSIEEEIISKYCINDYKTKTELTSSKLRTVITACIRTYVELSSLNKANNGLQQSMEICSAILSDPQYSSDITEYAKKVLSSVSEVISATNNQLNSDTVGLIAIVEESSSGQILASLNEQGNSFENTIAEVLPAKIQELIANASEQFTAEIIDSDLIVCIKKEDTAKCIAYLKDIAQLDDIETKVVSTYLRTMLQALAKRFLY